MHVTRKRRGWGIVLHDTRWTGCAQALEAMHLGLHQAPAVVALLQAFQMRLPSLTQALLAAGADDGLIAGYLTEQSGQHRGVAYPVVCHLDGAHLQRALCNRT